MASTDLVLRLLLAAVLGASIGLEREYHQKPAGLRTNILIAVGSALFTLISAQLTYHGGTPDRVAAQIVTGVGFLGGGAILQESEQRARHDDRTGHDWVNAAIGMAAGAGEPVMATLATVITLIVLVVLPPIETYFERRAGLPDHHAPTDTKR